MSRFNAVKTGSFKFLKKSIKIVIIKNEIE